MTTGKDVLDEYLEITLPISEQAFWPLATMLAFVALCFLVYAVLPRTADSHAANRIEAFKSWLGFPGATRQATALLITLIIIYLPLFLFAVVTTFRLFDAIMRGTSADPSTTPTQSLGLGALLVALLSAPFVIWRSVVAQKTVDVTEQGLITDRINAAVEGLGAEKTVKVTNVVGDLDQLTNFLAATRQPVTLVQEQTVPNMEVRIGAIYALERIARENLDFHVQIMEILCAYIRENSPAESAEPLHMPDMPPGRVYAPTEAYLIGKTGQNTRSGAWKTELVRALLDLQKRIKTRTDIQTTLEVLGRRTEAQRNREAGWPDPSENGLFVFDAPYPEVPAYPDSYNVTAHQIWGDAFTKFKSECKKIDESFAAYEGFRLNLSNTNLQGYDLQRLHLNGARFECAKMQVAELDNVQMRGAILSNSEMQGAHLWNAQLQGADICEAQMQKTHLPDANIQSGRMVNTQMQGANLRNALMQGAYLPEADIQGAQLAGVQMQGAYLPYADMFGASLRGTQMQRAVLESALIHNANLEGLQMSEDTYLIEATFRGAALRSVNETTMAQLKSVWEDIFADGSVSISSGDRPDHWPTFVMERNQFHTEWRKWQADPEGYTPPDPPED